MLMSYQQQPLAALGMYYTQDALGRLQDFVPPRHPVTLAVGEGGL
jgi:hypothetical protein